MKGHGHHQQQQPPPPSYPPQQPGWGNQPGYNQNQGYQPQALFNPNQDYIILSALNKGKALDVSQGQKDRNKILLWSKHGNQNQRYKIKLSNNGRYQIYSNAGGVLQVPGGTPANGTQLAAGQQMNSPGEFFDIAAAPGQAGAYYIKTFCGKAIDIA
jgi:hypothetical protein